jgi:DNA-binding HxlR family transcriptional regulator
MSDEVELLKEISRKLSQLIVLAKLSSSKLIAETTQEIKKDPILRAILDLADGSLSSSQIKQKVNAQTNVSERTIARRMADLVEKGALNVIRKGNEIYYENSGLYE